MKKPKPHVWIVEMKLASGKFVPTVGCALTLDDCLFQRDEQWKRNNPGATFRIAKYERVK